MFRPSWLTFVKRAIGNSNLKPTRRPKPLPPVRAFRPMVERLEDRLVPATHFAVAGNPATITAGNTVSFTVTALDPLNNIDPVYAGTVQFTTTDSAATPPANSTLTNGIGTFSIILKSAGNQTVTATDTATGSITGTSNAITVLPRFAPSNLFSGPANYPTGGQSDSVASGDFNGDGKLDLAVANADTNTVSILLGNGNGTFLPPQYYAVGDDPVSVAVGDFNNDGKLDVVAANSGSGSLSILMNNGNSNFAPAATVLVGNQPSSVAVGNFNLSGNADLAVANTGSNAVNVLLGNGNGTFGGPVNYAVGNAPSSIAVGALVKKFPTAYIDIPFEGLLFELDANDPSIQQIGPVNADGSYYLALDWDAFLGGTFDADITFLLEPNAAGGPVITVVAQQDFNQTYELEDGFGHILNSNFDIESSYNFPKGSNAIQDLVVANSSSNTVTVLTGDGTGAFPTRADYPVGPNPVAVALGDVNHDGALDIAVVNDGNDTVSVLLGNGNGTLGAAANYAVGPNPTSVAVGDFNGDGNLDLVVTCSGSNSVTFLPGTASGVFGVPSSFPVGTAPAAIALGDFIGNGVLDVAVADSGDTNVTVLLNLLGVAGFQISTPAGAVAGTPFNVTVTAVNGNNAAVAAYSGTVSFASSDSHAVLPSNQKLKSGVGTFSVTLNTSGAQTLTVTDTVIASVTGTSSRINVILPATHFAFSALPTSVAGTALSFTVTALDQSNNTATAYNGTVHFTSTDPQAALPPNTTLANGVGTFSLTLKTVNTQSVTVADTATPTIKGVSTVTVANAPATHFVLSGLPTTAVAGTVYTFTVAAEDQFGNTAIGYTGTVLFSSSDLRAVLPANSALTDGHGNFPGTAVFVAIFESAGPETLVAADNVAANINGITSTTVLSGAATHYVISGLITTAFTGHAVALTVTAQDQFNNTASNYTGTVTITSSDPRAVLPANAQLSGGVGIFSVTLKTLGPQSVTATDTVTSGINVTSMTTVANAPTTHFVVSGLPTVAAQGAAYAFTVTAQDMFNLTAANYSGTVTFRSSDPLAVLPANAKLTNGVGTFTVILLTTGSQTVTAIDSATSSITETSNPVAVNGPPASFLVNKLAPNVVAGAIVNFTVTALDKFTFATGYTGMVHFTSSDPLAVLPANATLTNGLGTFSVAFKTTGTETVTATDSVTSSISGSSSTVVTQGPATHFVVSGIPANVGVGTTSTFTVTAQDQFNLTVVNYTGTVHFTSSDTKAVLPADSTLTGGIGTFSATFNTAGNQTIAAYDTLSALGLAQAPGSPFAAGTQPQGEALADFNGDGKLDLAVVSTLYEGGVSIFLGNGDGTFQPFVSYDIGFNAGAIAAADVNGDGKMDLVILFQKSISVLLGNGDGTFGPLINGPVDFPTVNIDAMTVGDFNGDGKPDVAVAWNDTANPRNVVGYASVLLGNGNGTFGAPTNYDVGADAAAVATADFNHDGKPDLVVTGANVSVLLNNGNGTFSPPVTYPIPVLNPSAVAVGDFNVDGNPDIVVLGSFGISVLLGNQDGTFAPAISETFPHTDIGGVVVADLNHDGKPDLIIGVQTTSSEMVLQGNGDGTFAIVQTIAIVGGPNLALVGDFNGDGLPDLAVVSGGANSVTILLDTGIAGTTTVGVIAKTATHLAITSSGSASADKPFSFTVQALDGLNNIAAGYTGVVHFTTTDPGFGAAVPLNYTFMPGDAGVHVFNSSAILVTAGAQMLTAIDTVTPSITGTSVPITVAPSTANRFALSAPASTAAGVSFNFTVTAQDQFFNIATGYTGTVHFISSDPSATLPIDSTLTNGTGIFSATLRSPGSQTLIAYDAANNTITGITGNIAVSTTASHFAISAPSSTTAGNATLFTVTALDSSNNIATGYRGTVHFTSSDSQAGLAANATLTGGIGLFAAILKTTGNQAIIATDTASNSITGSSANTTVSAAAVNRFALSQSGVVTAGTAFNVTVTAQDPFGNTVTGYGGTLQFASSDPAAGLPAHSTLSSGMAVLSVTLKTPGIQTVSATDVVTSTITGSIGVNVSAGPVNRFVISAPSSSLAGNAFIYTVTAKDALGNTAPAYTGTVHISSSDPQATFSANATLTGGTGFFAAVLRTAGNQTLTATDTTTNSIVGASAAITVSGLAASHFAVSAPTSAITGTPIAFTVTALDPFNNLAAGYQGTVSFVSTDPAVSPGSGLPAKYTFTTSGSGADNGRHVFSATLKTPGSQTVTAIDTATASIAGTSNVIGAVGLAVTSFTPTSSGFTAIFNKPFNPTQINLYDTAGAYGPDDLTLTGPGAPLTSFRGSLIIDPTNTTITFVKTSDFNGINFNPSTGTLAPGTYTATLRSAANGFTDVLGSLLDGGSSYIATFVVTAAPVVVGIPAFARGPDSANVINLPNNVAGSGIPINLSSGAGVTSGQFMLQYNPAILSITGATVNAGLTGATLSLDPTSSAGNAVIDFTSQPALSAGVIHLGSLAAIVPNAAAPFYTQKALLHFSSVQLNGGAIAVTGDDAIQVVAYLGDVNGDGQLSGGDSASISRVSAGFDNNPASGIIGGFSAFRLADPGILGDLNTSGSVDAPDVTLINSFLAGTARAQLPSANPDSLTIPTNGPDPSLSVPSILDASAGSTVVVPVNIDTARPDGSTGMTEAILALRYDPQAFSVSAADVQLGSLLTSGWQLTVAINTQTGEIGIDLFSTTPIDSTAGGSLVTIALHVTGATPTGISGLELVTAVDPAGQRTYQTEIADSQGAMHLAPWEYARPLAIGYQLSAFSQKLVPPSFSGRVARLSHFEDWGENSFACSELLQTSQWIQDAAFTELAPVLMEELGDPAMDELSAISNQLSATVLAVASCEERTEDFSNLEIAARTFGTFWLIADS